MVDRTVPVLFLAAGFRPDDWVAVLLKSYEGGQTAQRVAPVSMVAGARFQAWLRFQNARRFNVFVGVNAITPGRRSRTRESVGAVRHVFLDADQDADHVLSVIAGRTDLPLPSYVLRSSKGRAHVLWRVKGFAIQGAEALQKHLASELGTDRAATSAAQLTRLPGFFNHKYSPAQLVEVDYNATSRTYEDHDFPDVPAPTEPKASAALRETRGRSGMPMIERARRYLAAVPPAIQGHRGDERTFRVCCTLVGRFSLSGGEALGLLQEWNEGCRPPWRRNELVGKIKSAQRHVTRTPRSSGRGR